MTTLTIRNLKEETKAKLRQQAAQKGHSMEEEARRILARAVNQPERDENKGVATRIRALVAELGGIDDIPIPPRVPMNPKPLFDE